MTKTEHLLTILSEECAEVSQRISKAIRFGLEEVQPEQFATNAERIVEELADLWAVASLLENEGAFKAHGDLFLDMVERKKLKVNKFMEYAKECGTIQQA